MMGAATPFHEPSLAMQVSSTALPGVLLIEPAVHADARGSFLETFSARRYRDEAGIALPFVQDNVSYSGPGVLRGLHFQRRRPQGKLVQVLGGAVFDVVVNVDPATPHFGQSIALTLSADHPRQLWIPPGHAHGFCVLGDSAMVHYKCTGYYDAQDEWGLAWNCPELAIAWPITNPRVSAKDACQPGLTELAHCLKSAAR